MDRDPKPTTPKPPAKPTRDDRLKAALKSNMARRKAQAKARASQVDDNNDNEE